MPDALGTNHEYEVSPFRSCVTITSQTTTMSTSELQRRRSGRLEYTSNICMMTPNSIFLGRDKSKPLPNLNPDSEPRSTSPVSPSAMSYNLVVCGASNSKDGFVFSDFMGFCMCLKDKGVHGTFLSCFHLEQHFAWLKNERGIDTIKFGKIGEGQEALISYSGHQFILREGQFFKQVGKEVLKDEVWRWINQTAAEANVGDVVNMIFECHGKRGGGLCLGSNAVYPHEFAEGLRQFKVGTQVNMISGACYSGSFVDIISAENQLHRYIAAATSATQPAKATTRSVSNRVRNSRYSQSFVQSLARIQLPKKGLVSPITLGDHEEFLKNLLARNIKPGHAVDPVTSFYSEPNNLDTLVEEMIFRDKIAINYQPNMAARRQRVEWPTLNETLLRQLRSQSPPSPPSPAVKDQVLSVIDDEISKCNTMDPCKADMSIVDEYTFRSVGEPDMGKLITELYWRARQQSAILDCFEVLVVRGFVDVRNIRLPMKMDEVSKPVQGVSWLLSCFEGPNTDLTYDPDTRPLGHQTGFEEGLVWLATMIVRGCADVEHLMETIEICRFFGPLNEKAFAEYVKWCNEKRFSCNPSEMEDEPNKPSIFDFWLPHGVNASTAEMALDALQTSVQRFNRIEAAYKAYFKLSDTVLACEDQEQEQN